MVESLLTAPDARQCAARAVDWVASLGAEQVACAVLDSSERLLVGLAGAGISDASFALGLDDSSQPVAAALARGRALRFARREPGLDLGPITTRSVLVVPLCMNRGGPIGVILAGSPGPEARAGALWVASRLAPRLASCLTAESALVLERQLLRHNGQLVSVVDAVDDPVILTSPEGGLIIANEPAEALFVAGDHDREGRRRAVALNNMLLTGALLQRAGASRVSPIELPLVDPTSGTDLLFELTTTVVRDGSAVAAVLRNVTDLRHASRELQGSISRLRAAEAEARVERDRLRMVIASVADPIVVTDAQGNLVLTNPPAERFLARPQRAGRARQRIVRGNDAHFFSFVSNALFASPGARWRGDVTLLDPQGGQPVAFEALAGKILSDGGELTAIVTILHDRTEAMEKSRLYEALERVAHDLARRVAKATTDLIDQNEVLRRQQLALEQASRLKSQFLASVSHEFRTPLNAMLGYTSMLLAGVGGPLSGTQAHHLARVEANARTLLATIGGILDISKIEAGKMPIHTSRIALRALVGEVLAELSPLIEGSTLRVTTRLSSALPALHSDRPKVKQVLSNLLSNALKFTPAGSVRVSARYVKTTDCVQLVVRDTGIGIAPEHHARVFEDFRQVDSSLTRAFAGAGLGLSICRRFAEALGGRMLLQSSLGQGSTFTLELPRRPVRRRAPTVVRTALPRP